MNTRLCHACRRFSNATMKRWQRADVNRLKGEGLMGTSENVLDNLNREKGLSFSSATSRIPTATFPVRLQVTVPQRINMTDVNFNPKECRNEGTYEKHFVRNNMFSENMVNYAKSSSEPEAPRGEQGFMWRLTRPLEALKKRFMGEEHVAAEQTKEDVEPVTTKATSSPTKSPITPPKNH